MSLFYRNAIERDLPRWREKGWVTPEGERAILDDLASRTPTISIGGVFGMIAAALICLSLASFIAANWDAISRPTKLGLLIGLLWLAYGLSIWGHRSGWRMVAHALLLIASSGFGGCIMLISQMYHLSGNPPDAVLMWAVGALAGGVLLSSAPSLCLAAILAVIWSEWEYWDGRGAGLFETFGMLALWLTIAFGVWRSGWRGGFHIVAIGLSWWALALMFRLEWAGLAEPVFWPSFMLGVGTMLLGALGATPTATTRLFGERSHASLVYGFFIAAGTAFLWQIDVWPDGDHAFFTTALVAAAVIVFVLLVLSWAIYSGHTTLAGWCYAALAGQLTYIYFTTLGTLLETSAFFIVAAAGIASVAIVAGRMQKREASA